MTMSRATRSVRPRPSTPVDIRRSLSHGFTLVEMLVAVAIFALASALAYGGLSALTRARSQLEQQNERLGRLQFAIGLIERDLRSAAPRAVRDNYGAPLPALSGTRPMTEAGLLASYGPDLTVSARRAATYVRKILGGTKPGDLPVELPTKLELVVNVRTADAIGVTVPNAVLARADQVIR